MRIPDELASLIREKIPAFDQRAVARELVDALMQAETPGEIDFDVQAMVDRWQVDSNLIWLVADLLVSMKMFQIHQGVHCDRLVCPGIRSSGKVVKKRGKGLDMAAIKKKAQEQRVSELTLKDAAPGAVAQICVRIPFVDRQESLAAGYKGWLPVDMYGIEGMTFVVTQPLVKKLEDEHPNVDIQAALENMFDDLRAERQSRPSFATAAYWIHHWIKKNGQSLTRRVDDESAPVMEMKFEADY